MRRLVTSTVAAALALLLPSWASAESPSRDCGTTSGYQTNAPWPGRARCPTGIALSPFEGPDDTFLAFNPTTGAAKGVAIAADGSSYVGNALGELRKFNAAGVQQWVRPGLGAIRGTPAIAASGRVYVATDAGYLRAINPATGVVIWSSVMTGWGFPYVNVPMHGSPVIAADGAIIVSNDAGLVQAVNPTGTPRWTIQMNGPVFMTAALSRDGMTVYVGSPGIELRAYAVADGALRWASGLLVGGGTPAVAANGTIFVPSSVGLSLLYAIDPLTGFAAWPTFLGFTGIFDKSPAIAPNGDIVIASDQGVVRAITQTGWIRWERTFGSSVYFDTAAIDAEGNIFIPSADGRIRKLRGDNGEQLWEYNTGGAGVGTPAINASNQLVVPANGRLYGLGRPGRWGTLFDPRPGITVTQQSGAITPFNQGTGGSNVVQTVTVHDGLRPLNGTINGSGLYTAVTENGGRFHACTQNAAGLQTPVSAAQEANMLGSTTASFDAMVAGGTPRGCVGVPRPALCPIDPASFAALNRSCSVDSDCPAGAVCAFDCGSDGDCTGAPRRCGTPYNAVAGSESCDTLPAIASTVTAYPAVGGGNPAPCAEILECSFRDGVPHHPFEEGKAYLDCPGPSAPVDDPPITGFPDRDPDCATEDATWPPGAAPPAPTPPRVGFRCQLQQENPRQGAGAYNTDSSMNEDNGRPEDPSSKKWDLSVAPRSWHTMSYRPKPIGRADIRSDNGVTFKAKATMMGIQFTLFDLSATAKLNTCDISTAAHAKLFGNLIDLQIVPASFNRSTAASAKTTCDSIVNSAAARLDSAKGAMMSAKNIMAMFKPDMRNPQLVINPGEYPLVPGLPSAAAIPVAAATPSQQICAQALLSDPNDTVPPLVTPAQCLASYTQTTAANVVNTYINRYNAAMIAANDAIAAERNQLANLFRVESGPIRLINSQQQFRQTFVNVTFPVGPIPLNLEIEGSGRYGLEGELQYSANFIEVNGLPPGVRASLRAGPSAGMSILAFVGVGFDLGVFAAKVGIAGSVNLIDVRAPLFAGIALQRGAPEVDTRTPLQSTSGICAGATGCGFGPPYGYPNVFGIPYPDLSFEPKKYRWELNYDIGAQILGQALSGSVDVRARVRFLFFSKTWSKVFVKIKGFSLDANFAIEGTAAEIENLYDLGSLVPEITFPLLPYVTDQAMPTASQLIIGGWAEQVTSPALQGFVRGQLEKVRPGTVGAATYLDAVGDFDQVLTCLH